MHLKADRDGLLVQITNYALAVEMFVLAAWPIANDVARATAVIFFVALGLGWLLAGAAHRRAGRDVDALWVVIEVVCIAGFVALVVGHTAAFAPAHALAWDLAAGIVALAITALRHRRDPRLRWSMVLWTLLFAVMVTATLTCAIVVVLAGAPAAAVLRDEAIFGALIVAFILYTTTGPALGFLDPNTIAHLIAMAGLPFLLVAFRHWP